MEIRLTHVRVLRAISSLLQSPHSQYIHRSSGQIFPNFTLKINCSQTFFLIFKSFQPFSANIFPKFPKFPRKMGRNGVQNVAGSLSAIYVPKSCRISESCHVNQFVQSPMLIEIYFLIIKRPKTLSNDFSTFFKQIREFWEKVCKKEAYVNGK